MSQFVATATICSAAALFAPLAPGGGASAPGAAPRPAPRDGRVARQVQGAGTVVARAHVFATIAERDLVPEGTAWNPATGEVLVGSMNRNKVVAISPDGSVRDLVPRGREGLGSVIGIHVEPGTGILWVTSNPRYDDPADTTRSALYAFDARTGAFRARYPAPGAGPFFLNDLTTGRDGAVYVTDTRAGAVWRLRPGTEALERFDAARDVRRPNGITISSDGKHLFVADGDHVRVIALGAGESWRLSAPDSIGVRNIDGLAFVDNSLIAHHPLRDWRVVRYSLDAAHRRVTRRTVIESGTPDIRTSTTGEIAGDRYVFIGNGQLDRMNDGTIDASTMSAIRMYAVALDPAPDGVVAVALSGRDSVAILDAQTLAPVATLGVGNDPHEVAASPDGRRVYVADAGAASITVIDAARHPRVAVTWPLPDSISVHDVEVSTDGGTVWAVSGARNLLLELDATSGRLRRRFPITRPGGWMVEPGGPDGSLVVANLEGGAVTLLTPTTGRQRALAGHEGEIDAAPSPDGSEIWSVNFRNDSITIHDLRTGAPPRRLHSRGSPGRVVFVPGGDRALVVLGGDSSIVAIDTRTKERVASVTVAGDPKVIALSPDGRRAYVSHPGRDAVSMIDVPSMTVLRTVDVPGVPDGVAVAEARGARRP